MDEENVVEPTQETLKTRPDLTTISPETQQINRFEKQQKVISFVKQDIIAADLKWSLFVSAVQSYKKDFCVRPYPPKFQKEGKKDFNSLMELVDSTPALQNLESSSQTLPDAVFDLLYWVFIELDEFTLSTVDKSKVDEVLGLVASEQCGPTPSLVVRLNHKSDSASESLWGRAQQEHGSFHAFHGSKTINFHSIATYGLQQHLTKNALFGQGVYLSSELMVCLPYSKTGLGWKNSRIGDMLSVVALCEIVDHPSVVRFCKEDRERGRASDSQAGDVPHKVYVVTNSDLIRVRYLLVWATKSSPSSHLLVENRLSVWIRHNKLVVSLTMYAAVLVAVGLSRSHTFWRLWRQLCRSLHLE